MMSIRVDNTSLYFGHADLNDDLVPGYSSFRPELNGTAVNMMQSPAACQLRIEC